MIAHQARHKLAKEANRPDHNLFRLVCHANMLDNLIYDLAHAEEEQESYLNRLSKAAAPKKATDKFQIVMEKLDDSDSEDESESDLETLSSASSTSTSSDSDDDDDDDESSEIWDETASPASLFADERAEQLASVLVVADADADELQEKAAEISITSIAPQKKPLRQSKTKATQFR